MDSEEALAPLEDACTVVLLRDGEHGLEVLMLERPRSSSAFGGAWVFPGGKVDPQDRPGPHGGLRSELAGARAAGLREVAEETGQHLSSANLVHLSKWTPMQRLPRRFRTWFLLARANGGDVALNPGEHEDYAWLTPSEVLRRHAAAEMVLVQPTWVTLHHLQEFATVQAALAAAEKATPVEYNSYFLTENGAAVTGHPLGVVWAGDEAYPGGQARPGDRHRLNVQGLPWVFECNVSAPALSDLD